MTTVARDPWISKSADDCTDGYECPFEELTIQWPESDTGLVETVGVRQGGERSARISTARLAQIARDHLRALHGVSDPPDATLAQAGHAWAIAAVACLMD